MYTKMVLNAVALLFFSQITADPLPTCSGSLFPSHVRITGDDLTPLDSRVVEHGEELILQCAAPNKSLVVQGSSYRYPYLNIACHGGQFLIMFINKPFKPITTFDCVDDRPQDGCAVNLLEHDFELREKLGVRKYYIQKSIEIMCKMDSRRRPFYVDAICDGPNWIVLLQKDGQTFNDFCLSVSSSCRLSQLPNILSYDGEENEQILGGDEIEVNCKVGTQKAIVKCDRMEFKMNSIVLTERMAANICSAE
ncbi:hypothetical protein MHBO_003177 [Bonamia ostreae]|uniref:Uncharacterized protein n=1 Tax=Bonamia ostreae TaxID=126728 RepID=A0ABV2APQ7_9EUKA